MLVCLSIIITSWPEPSLQPRPLPATRNMLADFPFKRVSPAADAPDTGGVRAGQPELCRSSNPDAVCNLNTGPYSRQSLFMDAPLTFAARDVQLMT